MKFFHISDLHIGLKLINRDLEEDQKYIFGKISDLAAQYKPDAVVIAGDIYDKAVPSADAVRVFDKFINDLRKAVPDAAIMMISGNHDSAQRVNCFRGLLSRQNVYMIGVPPVNEDDHMEKVTLRDAYGNVNFYLLPFVRPSMVRQVVGTDENGNSFSYNETLHRLIAREDVDTSERNVLVSHQFYLPAGKKAGDIERMDSETRTVGNIDEVTADAISSFDYCALGHIHKPMKVGSDFARYCGTPLCSSVSEAGQAKGVVMVEMTGKKSGLDKHDYINTTVLPLEPLRQVKVIRGTLDEVLADKCDDYVSVVLTDKVEHDVFDMKDRLHDAFPYLLEIRRESERHATDIGDTDLAAGTGTAPDPFELCYLFYPEMDDDDRKIMSDVINSVKEAT